MDFAAGGAARVRLTQGESQRLVLPGSMRGWRVSLRVDGRSVPLGVVARKGTAVTPVITPPESGRYTLALQGPRGQQRLLRLIIERDPATGARQAARALFREGPFPSWR